VACHVEQLLANLQASSGKSHQSCLIDLTSDLQVADLQVSAVKRVSNCCPISVWAL